jgi:hypothetical protein
LHEPTDQPTSIVLLESLLPDAQAALEALLARRRTQGARLEAHWKLKSRDRGSQTFEVTFEPTPVGRKAPALLASGVAGPAPVELEIALAFATPGEEEAFRRALAQGTKFTVLVFSHEVDVR